MHIFEYLIFEMNMMEGYHTQVQKGMSLVTRKPVFGVCDQARLKPACSASEAG